jgi:hypothetical protein
MKYLMTLLLLMSTMRIYAQDKTLPYYQIPDEPENFTAGAVASRMIDGLGFRYYWATEGLRPDDLAYKPGDDARTCEQTLLHIYDLSVIIVNSTTNTPNVFQADPPKPAFKELRSQTLQNLKTASDRLRTTTDAEMREMRIVFKRQSGSTEFPFWNQINGPIADALWHVGQVVSFRRSSGNPFPDNVNVFTGKVSD